MSEPYPPPQITTRKKGFGLIFSGLITFIYTLVMQVVPSLIGIIIILALVGPKVASQPEETPPEIWTDDPQVEKVLIGILMFSHLLGVGFTLLLLRLRYGSAWSRRIHAFRKPSLTHLILMLASLPALLVCFGVLEAYLLPYIPSSKDLGLPGLNEFMESIKRLPLGLAIVAIAVLPAINEELFCRGFLNSGILARYGGLISVVWVSFLFGVMHLEPPQALFAMLFGIVIHLVYLASRSLPLAMLLHFLNNALVVIETKGKLSSVFSPMKSQIETNPWPSFAVSSVILFTIGLMIWKTRSRSEENQK
ncbi:MAG: CPBP family intramembrane metalloprotease [Gemmataceae bacterium]|jgi:membrane protease YdiL (CAAX protease family)|nr:CPBP family intramembrane metalloprotease [Gemmataceae bacterium]